MEHRTVPSNRSIFNRSISDRSASNRAVISRWIVFAVAATAAALSGCSEEEADAIPEMSVEQVASALESDEAVAVDANGASTRAEHGVIPGATLLTSSGSYDPSAELPSDRSKTLVFYCANTGCRASDGAAERARDAGWENVRVMRAGIAGWVEAGHETSQPNS